MKGKRVLDDGDRLSKQAILKDDISAKQKVLKDYEKTFYKL